MPAFKNLFPSQFEKKQNCHIFAQILLQFLTKIGRFFDKPELLFRLLKNSKFQN